MLDATQIITYATALGVAAAIPGPGMTALMARSISAGAAAGFAMLTGLILGDLTYLSFAVFGMAILAKSFSMLFVAVKWAAIAYLCYLAWSFWHASHQPLATHQKLSRKDVLTAILSGYTMTLGNPKTIAFYLALLPLAIDLESISVQSWAFVLVPLTALVLLVVGAVFIFGALSVRRALSSDRAQKILHRGAAATMLTAAGTMAVKGS